MWREKELVLKNVRDALNDEILNGIVSISIKHGIVIAFNKEYLHTIRHKIDALLDRGIILGYHEIHYYGSDIIHLRIIYTLAD